MVGEGGEMRSKQIYWDIPGGRGIYASEMFKSFLIIIKFNVLHQNPIPKRQQGLLRPALVCFIWCEKRRSCK